MNKYTPDSNYIIDATGNQWAVETPHPLPLPEGIDEDAPCPGTSQLGILFGGNSGEWTYLHLVTATHWLARRPLPPVPQPKTQEEKDREAFEKLFSAYHLGRYGALYVSDNTHHAWLGWCNALAYARKEAE